MYLSPKEILKDLVVIVSSGAAIVFGGMSLMMIAVYIRSIDLINKTVADLPGYTDTFGELLGQSWSCLILSVIFVWLGVMNILYIQRYLRNLKPKGAIGMIANFGAVVTSLILIIGYFLRIIVRT